ncbi:hypothetical protein SAMN04487926_14525 [Paraburkholderia steynii]|uniref:Uncharacterized protein n=1 Tax=Paraburkholderia steynii TaxID=1245441 RepID=A0A7Z7BJ47_9BURK|nr:hypothetical protein [Paraburkholderia steynii]SDJ36343.1 hypothetical protein SAMN04487926_14525 [Paraburkholderia steynii]
MLRNDVPALMFYIRLNVYIRVWMRFTFFSRDTGHIIGQALRTSAIADEGGIMLTSQNSSTESSVVLDPNHLIFDHGQVEPDERSVTSGFDEVWLGWVRFVPRVC